MDKERRITRRVKVNVSACCGQDNKEISVFTKDISSRGAHLIFPGKINKCERFFIGLDLPAIPNPLSFQCEIVWTKKIGKKVSDCYEAGIKFLKTDPYDIARLERFLRLRDVPVREIVCQN